MQIKERLKKGINAYINNDAKAAAIASVLSNKNCSSKNLIETEGFDHAALGLLPLINNNSSIDSEKYSPAIAELMRINTDGRLLFLLCGPSSVGKDTLASYAKHLLYTDRINYSYVDKYTTRTERGFEGQNISDSHAEPSGNYEYFKNKEVMKKEKKDISLAYKIYDQYYAFSGNHLLSQDIEDENLLCIYGRFENIHKIRKEVFFKFKRMPFSILLTAPSSDLEGRILRRHSIQESEQSKRIREIRKQLDFIQNNPDLISSGFDLIIENGDSKSVTQSNSLLSNFIVNSLKFANKSLETEQ